jgi:hypothetical protein
MRDEKQLLDEVLDRAARAALAEGVAVSDAHGGPVHLWVMANVRYRPETEFFVVFLISCRMADILAQAEGYRSAADKAAALAVERVRARRGAAAKEAA